MIRLRFFFFSGTGEKRDAPIFAFNRYFLELRFWIVSVVPTIPELSCSGSNRDVECDHFYLWRIRRDRKCSIERGSSLCPCWHAALHFFRPVQDDALYPV